MNWCTSMERDACSSRTPLSALNNSACSAAAAHRSIADMLEDRIGSTGDLPKFSRCRDTLSVELRGECPRLTVDVLDAVSGSRRITRTELVNQIPGEWARQQLHEASLIARVTRGNPEAADLFPSTAD